MLRTRSTGVGNGFLEQVLRLSSSHSIPPCAGLARSSSKDEWLAGNAGPHKCSRPNGKTTENNKLLALVTTTEPKKRSPLIHTHNSLGARVWAHSLVENVQTWDCFFIMQVCVGVCVNTGASAFTHNSSSNIAQKVWSEKTGKENDNYWIYECSRVTALYKRLKYKDNFFHSAWCVWWTQPPPHKRTSGHKASVCIHFLPKYGIQETMLWVLMKSLRRL